MKVFLSYAHKDSSLASKIASTLESKGFDVWNAETEVLPGDNFAEKISDALKESDAMVVLLSPASLESNYVQWEIEYALGNKSYKQRVIPVLVGSEENISLESIPWILRKLQMIRLTEPEQADEEINQISEALELAA
ncbi:MAG: toll/interleukin-1 receptor domain-containing protein [Pyrinomonadaceae bacterium]